MTESPNGEARTEDFTIKGEDLVSKVKELVHEGNVRRVIIKNEAGETPVEIPLTIGVVGALVAPVWAAIGAIAALVADCKITVERKNEDSVSDPSDDEEDSTDD
jgi:hypothetical protein